MILQIFPPYIKNLNGLADIRYKDLLMFTVCCAGWSHGQTFYLKQNKQQSLTSVATGCGEHVKRTKHPHLHGQALIVAVTMFCCFEMHKDRSSFVSTASLTMNSAQCYKYYHLYLLDLSPTWYTVVCGRWGLGMCVCVCVFLPEGGCGSCCKVAAARLCFFLLCAHCQVVTTLWDMGLCTCDLLLVTLIVLSYLCVSLPSPPSQLHCALRLIKITFLATSCGGHFSHPSWLLLLYLWGCLLLLCASAGHSAKYSVTDQPHKCVQKQWSVLDSSSRDEVLKLFTLQISFLNWPVFSLRLSLFLFTLDFRLVFNLPLGPFTSFFSSLIICSMGHGHWFRGHPTVTYVDVLKKDAGMKSTRDWRGRWWAVCLIVVVQATLKSKISALMYWWVQWSLSLFFSSYVFIHCYCICCSPCGSCSRSTSWTGDFCTVPACGELDWETWGNAAICSWQSDWWCAVHLFWMTWSEDLCQDESGDS